MENLIVGGACVERLTVAARHGVGGTPRWITATVLVQTAKPWPRVFCSLASVGVGKRYPETQPSFALLFHGLCYHDPGVCISCHLAMRPDIKLEVRCFQPKLRSLPPPSKR